MIRNKSSRRFSQFRIHTLLTCAVAGVGIFAPKAMADVTHANSNAPLNTTSAWTNPRVPGPSDVVIFDSNSGTTFTNFTLGDNAESWLGIRLSSPPAGYTIASGYTLTLGTSGIDLSNSNQSLSLNNGLVLNGSGQTWNLGSNGGNLNIGGTVAINLGTVTLSGNGNLNVTGALSGGSMLITGSNASLSGADNLLTLTTSASNYTTALYGTRSIGTLALYPGTVTLNSTGAYGGGALILAGVTFDNLSGQALTIPGSVSLLGMNTTYVGSNNLNITGNVNLAGIGNNSGSNQVPTTLTLNGGVTTISGSLTSSGTNNQFIKEGTGQLIYTGSGSLSSHLSINNGTFTLTGTLLVSGTGAADGINNVGNTNGENALVDINGGSLILSQADAPYPAFAIGGANAGANGSVVRLRNNAVLTSQGQVGVDGNGANQYAALSIFSGSTLTVPTGMSVGGNNDYGIMNVYSGVVNAGSGLTIYLSGGSNTTSYGVGVININGGTLTSSDGEMFEVGQDAAGIVNISGNAYVTGGSITMGANLITNATLPALLNLTGGTLITSAISGPHSSQRLTYVNFNGGLLQASGADTLIGIGGSSSTALTNVAVWSGGAIINDNGSTSILGQALLAPTGNGVTSISLNTTGSGYLDQPIITLTGGGGFGAAAVAVVDTNGNFTGISIINPGQGYTSAPSVNILYAGPMGQQATVGNVATASNANLAPGGLTVLGIGTLSMHQQSTFTGPTVVQNGTLLLDFSGSFNGVITSNIIAPASTLNLQGGTILLNNTNSASQRSQTFAGLIVGPGAASGAIIANSTVVGATESLALGTVTQSSGGYITFNSTWGTQSATNGIVVSNPINSILGGYATVQVAGAAATWAYVNATGNIIGESATSMSATFVTGADVSPIEGIYTPTPLSINSLLMNDSTGATSYFIDATNGLNVATGGIMFTNNDTTSGHNVTISNGILTTSSNNDLVVTQNNTVNTVTISSALVLGAGGLVEAGPGELIINNTSSFTGKVAVYGGTLSIVSPTNLGTQPNSFVNNQISLNGTLLFNTNDNVGANSGVFLGGNSVINTNGFNVTMGAFTSSVNNFGITKNGTGTLTLAGNDSFRGNLTVGAGSVELLGNNSMAAGLVTVGISANVPASLIVNGGTLTPRAGTDPSLIVGSGTNGFGVFTMNSGVATFVQETYFGYGPNAADPNMSSYGAFLMNGGTVIHQSYFGLARGQTGNSAGVSILQMTGGTIIGNASNNFQIGAYQGTLNKLHAVAVLLGGTIGEKNSFIVGDSLTGILDMMGPSVGAAGTNLTAGTFTIGNAGGIASVANLDGGTVTSQVTFGSQGGLLNFNGGVLQPYAGVTNLITNSANGRAYIWGNGANFNSNTSTAATIGQALLAPDVGGVSVDNVSVTQNGTFSSTPITLTLAGGLPANAPFTASATVVATVINNTISGFMVTNPGYGYTSAPTATAVNTAGGTASFSINLSSLQGVSLSLASTNFTGGTGYIAPPVVAILPATNGTQTGGGTGASAYATVDTNGNLTGIVIASPGVGYTPVTNGTNIYYPTVSIIGGGGTGATIGQLSLYSYVSGGALNKTGSGTLTFSNSGSTFTGPINVNGGNMIVSGTFAGYNGISGLATVAGNATLTLTGKINNAVMVNTNGLLSLGAGGFENNTVNISTGASLAAPGSSATVTGLVTVANGGSISMAGGTIGTLTLSGGLSIAGGNSLVFDVGATASDTIVTGAINSLGSNTITLSFVGLPAPGSTFTLASYTGATPSVSLAGNSTKSKFDTFSLNNSGGGVITLSVAGNATPANAYWNGAWGAGWDNTDGGVNTNFNSTLTTNAQQYAGTNSTVIFASPTSGVSPVPTNLNTVLDTSFSIAGLEVNQTISLVSISNGTTSTVNTLTIGSGGIQYAAGSAGLLINANVALGATQSWVNNDTASLVIVAGNISGGAGAGLTLGGGSINITGVNSYAGGTTISGSSTVITVGSNTALGSGGLNVVNGGRLEVSGFQLAVGPLSGDSSAVIENNSLAIGTLTSTSVKGSPTTFAGTFQDGTNNSASLAVRFQGNGSTTLTGASSGTLTGVVAVGSGTVNLAGGSLGTTSVVIVGDTANSPGVLIINNGTLGANLTNTAAFIAGSNSYGQGALILNSGNANFSNELYFGFGPNTADSAMTSYGGLVITGGTLTHNTWLGLSRGQSTANSAGTAVLLMTGGYINGASATNALQVGAYQGAANLIHAVATLQGGNIDEGSGIAVGSSINGIANFLGTNATASTTWLDQGGGTGVLNLNAGTLQTLVTLGNVANVFNFNGGNLRANAAGNLISGSTTSAVFVWSPGANIDSNSYATTIAQPFLTPNSLGVLSDTITAVGSGYTAAPTVTFSGGGGIGAAGYVTVNTSSGVITGFYITDRGIGYTGAPTVTLTGGNATSGTAGTVTITATQTFGGITGVTTINSTQSFIAPPVVAIYPAADTTGGFTGSGVGASVIPTMSNGYNGSVTGLTITSPGVGYSSLTTANGTFYPYVVIYGPTPTTVTLTSANFTGNTGGGVNFTGNGTITISSVGSTYTGDTNIGSGKLSLTGSIVSSPNWNASGQSASNPTILAVSGTLSASTSINIGAGAIITSTTTGNITTLGVLTLNGPGTFGGLLNANVINVATGSAIFSTAVVTAPTVNLNSTGSFGGTLTAANVINVSSSGTLYSNGVVNVGTLNLNGAGTFTNSLNATNISVINTSLIVTGGITAYVGLSSNGYVSLSNYFYTPNLNVTGGVFLVNSSSATASTASVSGALGGSGNLSGNVTINSGGTLTTAYTPGTLTLTNNLNAAGGANFHFNIGSLVTLGTSQVITSSGTVNVTVAGNGNEVAGTPYTLMSYDNPLVAPQVNSGAIFVGFDPATLSVTQSSISVTINSIPAAPATAYFNNSVGDATWGTVNNGAQSNWSTDQAGSSPVTQLPGANTAVYLDANNYTSGTFVLGQSFTINSLNLTSNVQQPVTITTNGNLLTIGSGGINTSNGNQSMTINGNVALAASQTFNLNSSTLTISGAMSSAGNISLVKSGSGQLALNGANGGFGGSITLNQGTISLGSATALGNGSVSFLFGSGSNAYLILNGHSASIGSLNSSDSSAYIENGTTGNAVLTTNFTGNATFQGQLLDGNTSGSFGLTKLGTGTLTLTNNNNQNTGSTTVGQGELDLNNGSSLQPGPNASLTLGTVPGNSVLVLNNGGTITASGNTTAIGANASANSVMILNSGNFTSSAQIQIGTGGSYGALINNNGTITVSNWFSMTEFGGNAVFDMNGGSLGMTSTSTNITLGSFDTGTASDTAVANFFGGTITSANNIWIAENPGTPSHSLYVTVNMSGNAFVNTGSGTSSGVEFTVNAGGTAGTSTGILNLIGGTLSTNRIYVGSTSNANSILNFNGGNLIAQNDTAVTFISGLTGAYIWANNANIFDGQGTVTISQNLLAPTLNGISQISLSSTAAGFISEPVVTITGGGGIGASAIATVNGGIITGIVITNPGSGYTSAPSVTLTGGGVGATNGISTSVTLASNANAGGGLNYYGGTVTGNGGYGTLILSGNNTYTGPTTINNGVLIVSSNFNLGGPTSTLNFNSGTLRTTASLNLATGAVNRNIAVISNTNAYNVIDSGSVSSNILTIGGSITSTNGGSLSLIGSGKVIFNGVSSAPLYVGGNSQIGGNAPTQLGGTGTFNGPLTLQNQAQINMVDGKVGTLTLSGGLTLNSQTEFMFDLINNSPTGNDFLNGTAGALNGGQSITVLVSDLGVATGTYTLASFGSINGGTPNLSIDPNSVLGADTATAIWNGNLLQVVIGGTSVATGPIYWSNAVGGTSSGYWNAVAGSNTNFNSSFSGGLNAMAVPGGASDIYFSASNQTSSAVTTALGASMVAKGVYVTGSMPNAVTISGTSGNSSSISTLSLGQDGLNMASGAGSLTVSANVNLIADQTWQNANSSNAMTVSGTITGNQNLTLAGNISVGNANSGSTLTGNIIIGTVSGAATVVTLTSNNALGTTNLLSFVPSSSATLNINAGKLSVAAISGDSTATIGGTGALTITPNAVTSMTFAGSLTGGVSLNFATGGIASTLTLAGVGTYTGATTVGAGNVLVNGNTAAFSTASAFTVTGTLDMGGFNGGVGSLSGGGTITNNGASLATVSVGGTGSTFSGLLADGTAKLALAVSGSLILTNYNNTFTGGTTINSGGNLFPINSGNFLPATNYEVINTLGPNGSNVTINTGGELHLAGTGGTGSQNYYNFLLPYNVSMNGGTYYPQDGGLVHLGANGTGSSATFYNIAINGSGNVFLTAYADKLTYIDGYLTGNGTLTLQNAGVLNFASVTFTNTSNSNTFAGQINIDTTDGDGEQLQLASGNVFANATIDTGANGTASQLGTPIVFVDPLASASFGALQGSGKFALQTNNTTSTVAVALTVGGNNASTAFSGAMSGAGSFTKIGTGTLTITGANTYAGNTTISGGGLQIGNGSTFGSIGTAAIANSGNLIFNRSDTVGAFNVSNVITGSGTVTQLGTGVTTLTGAVNYNGPTVISSGKLAFGSGGSMNVGSISGVGSLVVNASTTLTSDGVNMPSGTWTINGIQVIRSSASGGAYGEHFLGQDSTPLSGTSVTSNLTFGAGAKLDLRNNALIVQATPANLTSMLTQVAADVTQGYITSSTAAANPAYSLVVAVDNANINATMFGGVPVNSDSIIVTEALKGDANLDGYVDLTDFNIWLANLGNPNSVNSTSTGDLNTDGFVDLTDFNLWLSELGHNVGTSPVPSFASGGSLAGGGGLSSGGAAATPEPASLVLLGLGAAGLVVRRKRNRKN